MAEMALGMKWIKYMLFTVNLMFVLTAALIISIGTAIFGIYNDFENFLSQGYFSPASLLIAVGIIMLGVAVFGCVGAARESTCMINTFALLLSVVFILEVSAAIASYSLQNGLKGLVYGNMRTIMSEYDESPELRESMDFLQSKLRCCGIDSADDWSIYNENYANGSLPNSCCEVKSCHVELAYEQGCIKILTHFISNSAVLLGTGAMMLAFIQCIGVIFSLILAKGIRAAKSERERRRWEIREQIASAYTQMEPHQGKTPVNQAPTIYIPSIGHTTT